MKATVAIVFCLMILLTSAPVSAHHAFAAEFDAKMCADVTGILTKVNYENPHAYLFLDVNGEEATFQLSSTSNLRRGGATLAAFNASMNKEVVVRGCASRNGEKNRYAASYIKLADGVVQRVGQDVEGVFGTKNLEIAMNARMLITLAAALLVAAPAWAQIEEAPADPGKQFVEARGNVKPVRLPPGGATPRMADGKPDLSGTWFSGPTGRANAWSVVPDQPRKEEPIPFKPEARAKIDGMTRAERELGRAQVACTPLGVPGMWTDNPYPHQIIMKPNLLVHLIESNNNWRVVRIPNRHKPAEEQEPLYMGDTATRWEGDTLVMETISFDTRPWIQGNGWYKTDQTKVTERLRRPSRNFLEYQYTVDDPNTLTKPWTSAWREFSLSAADELLTENFCTNNENFEQFRKLADQERKQ